MAGCLLSVLAAAAIASVSAQPGGGGAAGPKRPPVAILTTNPPGLWNNNGTDALNMECYPLVSVLFNQVVNAPEGLTGNNPHLFKAALGLLIGTGVFNHYEDPVKLHIASSLAAAMWNAAAAYHPTMSGLWETTGVARRPEGEHTEANRQAAMLYALLRVAEATMPQKFYGDPFNIAFGLASLAAGNATEDASTPAGVGNLVGREAVARHVAEAWNSQGTMDADTYPHPYSDWTNFVPANTAYSVKKLLNWQPLLETNGMGYFTVQSHITPQAGRAAPLLANASYIAAATAPPPYKGAAGSKTNLKAQAQVVLEATAALDDTKKMLAEYFNDKVAFVSTLTVAVSAALKWDTATHLAAEMHTLCMADAFKLVWREKIRHNAVRPISVIRALYEDQDVESWVQYKGKATLKGREWTSYLRTAPHAEYPSGTACLCAMYASYMRAMTGNNTIPDIGPLKFKAGCSQREPFTTPAADVQVTYATWDDVEADCAQSRLNAGVHFQASIDAARQLCSPLGSQCYAAAAGLLLGR